MNISEIILEKIEKHHRGKENAIKRKTLLGGINCVYGLELTDRELRNIYCQLPVVSCDKGIFYPIRISEVEEFRVYLRKKALPLFERWQRVASIHYKGKQLELF